MKATKFHTQTLLIVFASLFVAVTPWVTFAEALSDSAPKGMSTFVTSYIAELGQRYHVDRKTLLAVISCESGGDMTAIGTLSKVGIDRGALQVNDYYHGKKAKEMGFDLHRPSHSLEYGIYLMSKEGLKPWSASAKCVRKLLT